MAKEIEERFSGINSRQVWNTYDYMAGKFKKGGIFICVRNHQLQRFSSFLDDRHRNDFWRLLKVDRTKYTSFRGLIEYACGLVGYTNREEILNLDKWSANDGLFRYDDSSAGMGFQLYNRMFETLCLERNVPDIDCFLNKRDFPVLKNDGTEPYNNLYSSRIRELSPKFHFDKHAPILSACKSDEFADILIPTYEDWCRAVYQRNDAKTVLIPKRVFPRIVDNKLWKDKQSLAVFRGSSTGLGVTANTNQRLLALEIAAQNPNPKTYR